MLGLAPLVLILTSWWFHVVFYSLYLYIFIYVKANSLIYFHLDWRLKSETSFFLTGQQQIAGSSVHSPAQRERNHFRHFFWMAGTPTTCIIIDRVTLSQSAKQSVLLLFLGHRLLEKAGNFRHFSLVLCQWKHGLHATVWDNCRGSTFGADTRSKMIVTRGLNIFNLHTNGTKTYQNHIYVYIYICTRGHRICFSSLNFERNAPCWEIDQQVFLVVFNNAMFE